MAVRLIDAGRVSALRSQAIYHGLAHARTPATPPTVVLVTPAEPYVCIGYHQDLDHEIDVDYCRRAGLPVVRRETGGGAVYIDADQLFVQWVMGESDLPPRVEQRFALFAEPLVATYRSLGIDAAFRPINDVQVAGRKIVGTGAARIGAAEVLVGNFIFDFDTATMASILRAPSAAFRAEVARSLQLYMTSIRAELGAVPERSAVESCYLEHAGRTLGRPLESAACSEVELAAIAVAERRLASAGFLQRPGGLRRPGVKIHEDVSVIEAVRAGRRVTARLRSGCLESVTLSGPPGSEVVTDGLAAALRGIELAAETVQRAVDGFFRDRSDGDQSDGWVQAILGLAAQPPQHSSDRS